MKSHSDDEDDDHVCQKELRYMMEAASAIEFVFDSVDYNRDGFMDEWEFRKLLELISYGGSGEKGRLRRARLTSTKVYHIMRKLGGQPTARGKRMWRLRKVGMVVGARKMQSSQNKFGQVAALKHEHRVGSAAMKHDVPEDVEVSEEQEKLTDHDHGKAEFIILRSSIIEAAEDGKLEDVLGSRWIFRAQMGRVFSTHASVVLYALFIMHAPVTQKLFFYFSCENIAGRNFNKGDYSLECTFSDAEAKARSPEYESFAVLVVLLILIYSFGFPGYAISRLVKYRDRLHTPDVMQKFGFLYSNSRTGAEGWLMFGLLRKMVLIGFTVFFPGPTSAAIFCVVICVLSCALLNYLQPHRNVHLFYVVLASYVLTTLKYLSTILQNTEEHKEDMFEEGYRTKWLPILIDSCYALICSSYALMIVYQALTGSREGVSIDIDAESVSSQDSSEEEWEETFGRTTTAKSKKKKLKQKLKQYEEIEQAEKKTLLEQKALSSQRLTLRLPGAMKQPKLKRANSGHSAAPESLVRWFEKVRVGLGSKIVERLASIGITSIHDFSHTDQGSLDGLKLLMKKTERKRFQRGVDSIRKKMMLAGQVAEIESLDKLIKSSEKTPDNEDNTAALRARRRQMKSKLKVEVDLSIKIQLESDIKRMLQKVAEDGTDVNERERLRASIKSAKEQLAAKVAQLDMNTQ
jgi:hypothetical protein